MVLELHMFLKEKRDGKTRARTVAGGNKQRGYIHKEDASSPTVATESVLFTCIIDTKEGRDVAEIDIPTMRLYRRVLKTKRTWLSLRFAAFSWKFLLRSLQMSTNLTSQRTRKEWNSYWFSARTHSTGQ
jgi:hypothetical protein